MAAAAGGGDGHPSVRAGQPRNCQRERTGIEQLLSASERSPWVTAALVRPSLKEGEDVGIVAMTLRIRDKWVVRPGLEGLAGQAEWPARPTRHIERALRLMLAFRRRQAHLEGHDL